MKFGCVASPEELAVMEHVLNAYCIKTGVTNELEREYVAAGIVALYELGLTTEADLVRALGPAQGRRADLAEPNSIGRFRGDEERKVASLKKITRLTDGIQNSRSSSAVVILASPKMDGHSPKARLVVTMIEVRSSSAG
jgi:hypothetical protein